MNRHMFRTVLASLCITAWASGCATTSGKAKEALAEAQKPAWALNSSGDECRGERAFCATREFVSRRSGDVEELIGPSRGGQSWNWNA